MLAIKIESHIIEIAVNDQKDEQLFTVKFNRSDDELQRINKTMKEIEKQSKKLKDDDLDGQKEFVKHAMDGVFNEGTFERFYSYVPSTTMIARYFYELIIEIKQALEQQDLAAIENKYV